MSDAMAIGAIRAIHERGRAVPGEVSVVGFDDVDLAASTDPPLTTVHQPVRGKGEEAVRLLLSVMDGRDPAPGHRRLETHLVVRSSTGPGRSATGGGRGLDRRQAGRVADPSRVADATDRRRHSDGGSAPARPAQVHAGGEDHG